MSNLPMEQEFSPEQVKLIKESICKEATNQELALFMNQCKRTGLDPFSKQIYAFKQWDSTLNRKVMNIGVSIDGSRLVAERTNKYQGQTSPEWCGSDGVWKEVWTSEEPPIAARVGVWKHGARDPIQGVAHFREYVQRKKDGQPFKIWSEKPCIMLSKCAEQLALRKAFPQELSGLYAKEELGVNEKIEGGVSTKEMNERIAPPKKEEPKAIEGEVIQPDAPQVEPEIELNAEAGKFFIPKTFGRHGGKSLSQMDAFEAKTYYGFLNKQLENNEIDNTGRVVLGKLKEYLGL